MLPYSPAIVAEAALTMLDQAIHARGVGTLAIPGGRSPLATLTALAGLCPAELRCRLALLWVDERAVPAGHPECNHTATLAAWDAGGARPAQVLPMPADAADLHAAAEAYGGCLARLCPEGRIDVCLLGVGEDGHIASLFPEHPALDDWSVCTVVDDAPKPPPRRLTLTLATIARARARLVLCLGAAKGWAYAAWRRGPRRACPASLLPRHDTWWYLDEAAGEAALRAEAK
ncbi:MAG: 6-phosphogluconolactonase [Planctomycetota bacterium]|nr:6-phosphogluconolactonase [Planctomycetota bacterium]MCX8040589.1 6-phosphogluconolactonase [Planctomycetota bacterium]MDW8373061.1 6-phosphogluconolactonase [Planctomycetota bacterium]